MFRLLIAALIFTSCVTGFKTNETPISFNENPQDTLFILKETKNGNYHAIFIETNKQSKFYEYLTYFDFEHGEDQVYFGNIKEAFIKNPDLFHKHKRFDLPRDWVPLHHYKNKFYLYAPSDWGSVGKRMINDSAFVYWHMDGPMPYPIKSFFKLSENKYKVQYSDPLGIQNLQTTIHIIDPKTKLAVFEYGKEEYQLYVPAENALYYDIVVNYCLTEKQTEFKFDKIDYKKLLGK